MDLIGKALQYLQSQGKSLAQGQVNLEKQHPLYGQLQAGVREGVAPIMRNFTSQKEVDKYKGFSQPNNSGMAGAVARLAGQQVPQVPLMLATEGLVGPVIGKFAGAVPQGNTAMQAALAGAAKGAIKFAPYGWTGGLEYAKNGDERGNNIMKGIGMSALTGAGLGAAGNTAGYGVNKLMQGEQTPPIKPPSMQQVRDIMGRYTNQKTPANFSPARGKLYSRPTVRVNSL